MARRRLLFAACSILLLSAVLPVAVAPGVGRAEDSGGVVAEPAPPAAQADLVAVDPAGDPWLREQGPPVPEPDETPREQVVVAWSEAGQALHARGNALRRVRLERGLGDLTAPAYAVLAAATEEDPHLYSGLARELAPGVPALQMAHARALWETGDTGRAVGVAGDLLWSLAVGLDPQLWLLENLTTLLLVIAVGAALAFIGLSSAQAIPHAAHDLGDLLSTRSPVYARYAALAALLLLPLALGEGIVGLTLSLFTVGFAYGRGAQRKMLAMAAVLFVIGLHPLGRLVSVATGFVEQDPIMRSTMALLAGEGTTADEERLAAVADEDPTAAHALAYQARRYGLASASRERLEALAERWPEDGVVLANLGNAAMRRGETEVAIDYYERAAQRVDSAELLFDLSQAYASAFRLEEYEKTLARAQRLDAERVAALSNLDDAKLVADLGFPASLLRERIRRRVLSEETAGVVLLEALAPGHLGDRWFVTAGAFALAALLCLLFADRYDHSSLCVRCGHRICTRCEDTVWNEEICDDCHHLFDAPAGTDPTLRRARLEKLSRRAKRIDRGVLGLSLLVPGVAGFAARRPDFALFGLLLFGWIAAWIAWPTGVFEDPILMGPVAALCIGVPGVLAVAAYLALVAASLMARRSR
ncbi:MAG: hypothetical protein H6748_05480 [Spirochaetaceae bacterium]|nr:hypothetical protein [Myxococcales bacterium]MCB9723481.1 hypothetical protein [Spirochaetaceae bacterium]